MDKLTPKQKAFADNYIILGNATEATRKPFLTESGWWIICYGVGGCLYPGTVLD